VAPSAFPTLCVALAPGHAIPRKAWAPKITYPPVRVVFYSDGMFDYGIRDEIVSDPAGHHDCQLGTGTRRVVLKPE